MRSYQVRLLIAIFAVTVVFVYAAEPRRDAGISVHLQPERVGRLTGETGGFDVRPQPGVKERKLFPTAEALYSFVKSLPASIRENGIWVVTTHPAAYAESELKQLSVLEDLCKKGQVPLFVARASELPGGWQRKN